MPVFELEYTICQIQSGHFSMAAKSHRQDGGNPQIGVEVAPNAVTWHLTDLEHGVPETVAGQPRVDRIDFYFRLELLRSFVSQFPAAAAPPNPARRSPPRDSRSYVRPGGKWVRLDAPICRFMYVPSVELLSQRPPSFRAVTSNAILHFDFETGPATIYGQDIAELHFGIEAEQGYALSPLTGAIASEVSITLDHELYATVVAELLNS